MNEITELARAQMEAEGNSSEQKNIPTQSQQSNRWLRRLYTILPLILIFALNNTLPYETLSKIYMTMGIIVLVVGGIMGIIGLNKALNENFYLHHGTKDAFVSIPLVLLNWASIALLVFAYPNMQPESVARYGSTIDMMPIIWYLSMIWIGCRVVKCNNTLTKGQVVLATSGRIFVVSLTQILSFATFMALRAVRERRKEIGSVAKDSISKLVNDTGVLTQGRKNSDKELALLIALLTIFAVIGRWIFKKIDKSSREGINLRPFTYGFVNIAAVGVVFFIGLNQVKQMERAPLPTPEPQATAPITPSQPETTATYDFTPDDEEVATGSAPRTTPQPVQQEEPTATPAAEPVESDNPMIISTEEPQPAADTTPSAPQISVPTVDMPVQPEIVIPTPEPQTEQPVIAPSSVMGKRIRFNYTDTRYRDGISRGGAFSWNAWQDRDLSQYSGWVALAAPPKLMFTQGNKGIYNPGDGSEDDYIGFILAGTYQAGQGNTASIRRELTYNPDTAGDASGEYVLTFDTPTSGTAELKNCARGESCFECENIKFVIEEISEEDLNPHTEDTSAEGGLSEAEKAELQDFLESLIMISSRSSSTIKLYQGRLLMLLPMIQEGAPVDVTTVETKGNTALHYACGMGRVDIVEWLVNHGADVNKQTDKGATPLDCVSGGYNAAEIRRILTQHGATKGKKGRR